MALITLQTRLIDINQATNKLKDLAGIVLDLINSGPLPCRNVGMVKNRCNYLLTNIIPKYENDAALADYADLQFAQTFTLLEKIANIKALLNDALAETTTLLAPYLPKNYHISPPFDAEATVTLKGILQNIFDAISYSL